MTGRKQVGEGWGGASRRLANLLRTERLARERSQESIARQAGLALSTVRKIESNHIREPGVFTVIALLQALEVPIAQLINVAEEAPSAGRGDHNEK